MDLDRGLVFHSSREVGDLMITYTQESLQCLDLDPPEPGYFNHNGHALYLFKTPARQWRRGFCADNHEIYNPFRKILNTGAYKPGFGALTISSIFAPKYADDPETACQKLTGDCYSIALSKHLMLSKSPLENKPFPMIWFNCDPVGFVRGNRFVIEDDIFQQEIEDELNRIGHQRWIF